MADSTWRHNRVRCVKCGRVDRARALYPKGLKLGRHHRLWLDAFYRGGWRFDHNGTDAGIDHAYCPACAGPINARNREEGMEFVRQLRRDVAALA